MSIIVVIVIIYFMFFSYDYNIMSLPIDSSINNSVEVNRDSSMYYNILSESGIKKPQFLSKDSIYYTNNQVVITFVGKYVGTDILISEWYSDVVKLLKKHKWNQNFYPSQNISYFNKGSSNLIFAYRIEDNRIIVNFIFS